MQKAITHLGCRSPLGLILIFVKANLCQLSTIRESIKVLLGENQARLSGETKQNVMILI